ncbi:MAG TPA: hypothetical protein VKU41_09080 [Polyangiaceae bacterium]|nr:hypothetical protein [Polyangiaceae bacterium]
MTLRRRPTADRSRPAHPRSSDSRIRTDVAPPDSRPSGSRIKAAVEPQAGRWSESRVRTLPGAVSSAPESGQYALRFTLIRQILRSYLSPIIVDSVLDKALRARDVKPAMLGPDALSEITSDIMVGLRLFVPEDRLPNLMLELAEVLGEDFTS